jgi:raffinose/stachyose/melibiose transport system permease protein
MGINLLIFYAGLSNIDEAVWEAAEMDGAKPFTRFFMIDLPLLLRQFKLLLILGIIGGVQAFENVLVMTQGGPGWQTMLPGLYMYRSAMSFNEYGFACAVGVALFLMVLSLSLVVNRGFPSSRT